MKLAKFLDKYDTVIFDMDGVITSEENYWNSAALTVWEYLRGYNGLEIDTLYGMEHLKEIRQNVFQNDEIIRVLKGKGVNSNWDLGYVTVLISLIVNDKPDLFDFKSVLEYALSLGDNIIEIYDDLALRAGDKTEIPYNDLKRNGRVWLEMHEMFQEWFLGDELHGKPSQMGFKTGLLSREEPIVNKNRLLEVLRLLSQSKRVCTGTGRPYIEMIKPLTDWGAVKYFAADGLCNYNHVEKAERELNNNALTKPHPYMFLKALLGTEYDDRKIVDGEYEKSKIARTLIVGDAGADILAARAMGADFCAVLTGIQGEGARGYFENLNAEYILKSVEDFVIEE